jgi:hypothetical protein
MRFEVVEKGTPALDGKAIRSQVSIYFTKEGGHGTVPSDFDVYIRFMQMHLTRR